MSVEKFAEKRYTQNRELSWLKFNERVLAESSNKNVPLLERFNFVDIFTKNLSEFFMIRVGSLHDMNLLKKPFVDNKSFMTPAEQLAAIFAACVPLYRQRDISFAKIEAELEKHGIHRYTYETLPPTLFNRAEDYFNGFIMPVLSPQIIDPRHPFPHLENDALYIIVDLKQKKDVDLIGIIPVPHGLPRALFMQEDGISLILMENLIAAHVQEVFDMYKVTETSVIRVTRNADINPDDESFDDEQGYRMHMQKILKKRTRLSPVRLESTSELSALMRRYLCNRLNLTPEQIFTVKAPLDLSYHRALVDKLPDKLVARLSYAPFTPQVNTDISPMTAVTPQLEKKDVLLSFPYESTEPFLQLIKEACDDPTVISIKITLYRLAPVSRLAEHLIAAAEGGKEVFVLMELRARFDEANNIQWAERFEEAGCNVQYGFEGYKVHSKICLITRTFEGKIHRTVQLGTGNYNEQTAKLYSDLSLLTTDAIIGDDATRFFKNMATGNLEGEYSCLKVAPHTLRKAIESGIESEIEKAKVGSPGRILFKMNSLTDRVVIDKLIEASKAGVTIDLIIRGICCLVPGIPGVSDTIRVISIVGRYLEHSRIYCFGSGEDTRVYLSSADMMTRNTERRVEIMFPLIAPALKTKVLHYLDMQLLDTRKAWRLERSGSYSRVKPTKGDNPLSSQDLAMQEAIAAAESIPKPGKAVAKASKLEPVTDVATTNETKLVKSGFKRLLERLQTFFSRKKHEDKTESE